MKKMAFVDLTNYKDWPMGGMLEYELAILPFLAERFDIDLWGFSVNGITPDPIVINGKEYPIHVFGNSNTGRRLIPNYFRGAYVAKFKKAFADKYDVVYCHSGSCAVGAHFAISDNTKLVYQQHGLSFIDDHHLNVVIQKPFYNYAQKYSDLVLVVSDAPSVEKYAQQQRSLSDARYLAIGSPIDLGKFDAQACKDRIVARGNTDAQKFVYTGRLTKHKNTKTLVAAFELYVKNGHPNAILNIAGDGEEYEIINRMRVDLGIQKNVNLLGKVPHDDVNKLLAGSDVFMIASEGEGCSISVLEAYASGLPVICGRKRGLEGQVIDNGTGVFVSEMTAKGFYDAMIRLNQDIQRISLNTLDEVKKYDRGIIAYKIADAIENLFANQ